MSGVSFQIGFEDDLEARLAEINAWSDEQNLAVHAIIKLATANPAEANFDDEANTARLKLALETAGPLANISLQLDTYMDIDRGYHPRHGLIDRRSNLRPAGLYLAKPLTLSGDWSLNPLRCALSRLAQVSMSGGQMSKPGPASPAPSDNEVLEDLDRFVDEAIRDEARAIEAIPRGNPFGPVTELIFEACNRRRGKIITTGVGKAGEVAGKLAKTFCSTGTQAVFLHPLEALHGDLGVVAENDVLLAFSNSGQTREILELITLAKKFITSMPIIVVTGNRETPLAEIADHVLDTGGQPEICPLGLTPTTSTTVMSVVGDLLICLQVKRNKFTTADYAVRHHGGYLGAKALYSIQDFKDGGEA